MSISKFNAPTAFLILTTGAIVLIYYLLWFSPGSESEDSSGVEEKHSVEKRAARRTIIKISKPRRVIIKCCGNKRCQSGGKGDNGTRGKTRKTLNPKRSTTKKTGGDSKKGANGTAAVGSAAGGAAAAGKDQAGAAGGAPGSAAGDGAGAAAGAGDAAKGGAKPENPAAGEGGVTGADGKANGGAPDATGSPGADAEGGKTPAHTADVTGGDSSGNSANPASGFENGTAATGNSSQPFANGTAAAAGSGGTVNGSAPGVQPSNPNSNSSANPSNPSTSSTNSSANPSNPSASSTNSSANSSNFTSNPKNSNSSASSADAVNNSNSTNATNIAASNNSSNDSATGNTTTSTSPPCNNSESNYTLSTDKLSWAKARLECKKKGMDLANLETPEENTCVKYLIAKDLKTDTMFWQALNKIGYSDYVEWISGKALTYNDWGAGEPAAFATDNCVGIEKGHWVDANCLDAYNYVCETPQPVDICEDYPVYVVSADKQNFDNARAECKKKNMDLVNVETREENVCIERQLAMDELSKEEIWMGMMKTGGANYTTWLNGKQLTYTDWDAGNPGQYAAENCVMFNKHHWLDSGCSNTLKYICESTVVVDPCQNMTNKYVISNDSTTWAKARLECKKMGAGMELVSLETEEENNCVKKLLKDAGKLSGFIWHSLNMFGTADFTHWANGEPLTYKTGWAKGQPAQYPYQACGLYEFNGKWGDFPCDWKALYVCESNQLDPCKPGQFLPQADKKTFDNAAIECKKKGMTLAIPETREENKCMQFAIAEQAFELQWMYIGLHKRGEANFSKWMNDAPLTYTDYIPGQPEFGTLNSEPCYIAWLGHWATLYCDFVPHQYVCEAAVLDDPCKGLTATYTVSTNTLSWGAARAACKKQNADLVSIETEQENKCVKEKIQLAGKSASIVFTALNKMGLKDYSQWFSGAKITFSGWNAGEPAQLSTENCGAFQNGKWVDTACVEASAYVCESPASQDDVCKKYNFTIPAEKLTYDNARFECMKRKMSLVSLKTVEENMCLQQQLAELGHSKAQVWIGLDKRSQDNFTKWENGEALTYFDWDKGAPENHATKHCIVALNHHWADALCSETYLFACGNEFKDPCTGLATFTVSTDTKKWFDARAECKKKSGDLAALETPEENFCAKFLIYSAGKANDKVFHSLNHIGTVLFSYWANGERLTYNGFKDGYNNKVYSDVLCAAFEKNAWVEAACDTPIAYMCESNPAPKEICTADQHVISADMATYDFAITKCQALNMKLVSLETMQENMCAQRHILLTGAAGQFIFTGLSKRGQSNYTKWVNGEALTYLEWPPGQPDSFMLQHCVIFWMSQWYDYPCESLAKYLCEKS